MTKDAEAAGPVRETAWVVITGPPSAGKTSLIEALARRGHWVVAETARRHIASLGRSAAEMGADVALQRALQLTISRLQRRLEDALPAGELVFLDRALPDSLAYFARLGLPTRELALSAARARYRHVFFLEGLPLVADGLRFEAAAEAQALAVGLLDAYRGLGYEPVRVPAFAALGAEAAVAERLRLITERVERAGPPAAPSA